MRKPPPGQNRLAFETSPYLLQHAGNPVDWYPWGEEAFAKARLEGKPMLVSIGYSACHWCHVMEHESFEDPETAKVMNELFVCIKVDREERPDVDEVYMTAVQLMGIHGGWPLNVFLAPDGTPFFGGTYFPPDRRYGRASWVDVLAQISAAWHNQRDVVDEQGKQLLAALRAEAQAPGGGEAPEEESLSEAADSLVARFDPRWGGFGESPKFPPSLALRFLLRRHQREGNPQHLLIVERTLRGMAEGGMYDQLGGGFHRYSVDEQWLVPHFEKMLYDNALLSRAYVEAYQVTGDESYARIARETLEWVLREMTDAGGGFRSATDADSDGREGLYFVWTKPEIEALLGSDAPLFLDAYGVTAGGNFEDPHHPRAAGEPGQSVLHVAMSVDSLASSRGLPREQVSVSLAKSRATLFAARASRTYPGLDDKVLASWNALMISAFAYAGRVLDEPRFVAAAVRAAEHLTGSMRDPKGRLFRSWRNGEAKIPAFLEDHAYASLAFLDLYEATFDTRWFREAASTARTMDALFGDAERGGWFHTAADSAGLVARPSTAFDSSIPAPNGAAALACARLAAFTGDSFWGERADASLERFGPAMDRAGAATITLLMALEARLHPGGEVAFAGRAGDPALAALVRPMQSAFLPNTVFAQHDPNRDPDAAKTIPLLAGKSLVAGGPAMYVCRDFACQAPVTSPEDGARALAELRGSSP